MCFKVTALPLCLKPKFSIIDTWWEGQARSQDYYFSPVFCADGKICPNIITGQTLSLDRDIFVQLGLRQSRKLNSRQHSSTIF